MSVGARSDLPRLISNYGRLGVNLLMGLILLPILLHWLGNEGYGLFQLVYGSVGLALLFDEVTRSSLIRELAKSYHSPDSDEFRKVYNTGLGLSSAAAVLSSIAFIALYFIVPKLNISPEMIGPARALVIGEGVASFLGTLLSPTNNMFVVTFRFIADNCWQVLRRSSYVLSACFFAYVLRVEDPVKGFTWFVLTANVLTCVSLFISAGQLMLADRRMIPSPRFFDMLTLRTIWSTVMWNTLFNLAMNLYERTAGVLMNIFFGVQGNVVWGVALQLSSYVRMTSLGVNSGIDAMSAKISVDHGGHGEKMSALVRYATVLHALVSLPVAALIFGLTEPMVLLWVGKRLDNPATQIPEAVLLTKILLIPVTVRAISDCWTRILYGAGFVARFSPMVLVGGMINPPLAWLVLRFAPLPEAYRPYVPAASFALVYSFFHFFLLPIITVRCLHIRRRDIFLPMARPALASAIAMVLALIVDHFVTHWTLISFGAALAGYGALTAALALTVALTPSQRRTVLGLVRRRLG